MSEELLDEGILDSKESFNKKLNKIIIIKIPKVNYKKYIIRDIIKFGVIFAFSFLLVMTLIYSVEGGTQKNFFKFFKWFGLGYIGVLLIRSLAAWSYAKAYRIKYSDKKVALYLDEDNLNPIIKILFLFKPRAKNQHTSVFVWEQLKSIKENNTHCIIRYNSPLISALSIKMSVSNLFEGYDDFISYASIRLNSIKNG